MDHSTAPPPPPYTPAGQQAGYPPHSAAGQQAGYPPYSGYQEQRQPLGQHQGAGSYGSTNQSASAPEEQDREANRPTFKAGE